MKRKKEGEREEEIAKGRYEDIERYKKIHIARIREKERYTDRQT